MPTPSSNSRVGIEIYVDDQGTLRVREFKDDFNRELDQVEEKSRGVTERIRSGWASVKGAWFEIIAAAAALKGAWDAAGMAAKARQEQAAFENLAQSYGTNAKTIIAALKEASGETIATMDLIRASGTAMMMGIDPDTVVSLMEVARATAKMTGQDVSKAFDDIALAVGRQSRMILDNLGIIVDVEKANEDYAASLGKTAAQLTDADRKQAFLNATLAGGRDLMARLGDQADTEADRMQRFSATVANLRVLIGDGLIRAFQGLLVVMYTVEAGLMTIVQGASRAGQFIAEITDKLHLTTNAADQWKYAAEGARDAGIDFAEKAAQNFKDMVASQETAVQAQARYRQEIDATRTAVDAQAEAEQKLSDQQKRLAGEVKKQAGDQAQAADEMYREIGQGADQYFQKESSKLVEKAAKWQQAGGDVLAVEEWLYDELSKLSEEAWGKGEEMAGVYIDNMQAQTATLVDSFNAAQQSMTEQLEAVGVKAGELDGTQIGLVATFDGTAVMQGLDQLIARFNALQETAAGAAAGESTPAAGGGGNDLVAGGGGGDTYSTSTIINVNQQVSRSDVVAIAEETKRRQGRV
ncbi:MAG: hypothetical protein WC952_14370 [Desulfobulbaceae bacterium]